MIFERCGATRPFSDGKYPSGISDAEKSEELQASVSAVQKIQKTGGNFVFAVG